MILRSLLGIFFTLTSLRVSAQYQFLLHKNYAERYPAIDSAFYESKVMRLDSATMFADLDRLAKVARENGDEELYLESQLIRHVYDMVGPQQNRRRGEAKMQELKTIADEKKILHLQIRAREKLAYYYYYIAHKHGAAFEHYLGYYQLLKNVRTKDFPEKQELISHIGSAYFNFGDNTNARKYFDAALKATPSKKIRVNINLQNTLGLIYRSEKKYPQAERIFRQAYSIAAANQDSTWMGITAGNIGITYFLQQKYKEAIPLLKFDVQESFKAREIDNGLSSLITLMRIYQQQQDWEEVKKQIPVVRKMLPFTGNPVQHLKPFYIILSQLYAAERNFAQAYHYADSVTIVNDTINARRNTFLLARAEHKVEVEQHEAELEKLAAKEKIQKIWTICLAAGVVLLIIIALLVIKQQRLRYILRQEQLRLQKEMVEAELEQAKVRLQDFTRRMVNKRKLIEQFEAELKEVRATSNSNADETSQTLVQLQQATILTDDQWEDFRQMFEKVHRGYLQNLKEKVPGLSPAETRFMVLSKLGLSNKEMAGMLGVSTEAIRQTRHRIRKKLTISSDQTVEDLVASI